MKVLVTSDFYSDFELIETDSIESAEQYIMAGIEGRELPQNITVISSSNGTSGEDAISQADKILYVSEYMD